MDGISFTSVLIVAVAVFCLLAVVVAKMVMSRLEDSDENKGNIAEEEEAAIENISAEAETAEESKEDAETSEGDSIEDDEPDEPLNLEMTIETFVENYNRQADLLEEAFMAAAAPAEVEEEKSEEAGEAEESDEDSQTQTQPVDLHIEVPKQQSGFTTDLAHFFTKSLFIEFKFNENDDFISQTCVWWSKFRLDGDKEGDYTFAQIQKIYECIVRVFSPDLDDEEIERFLRELKIHFNDIKKITPLRAGKYAKRKDGVKYITELINNKEEWACLFTVKMRSK